MAWWDINDPTLYVARLRYDAGRLLRVLEKMVEENEPAREDSPRRASNELARRLSAELHDGMR